MIRNWNHIDGPLKPWSLLPIGSATDVQCLTVHLYQGCQRHSLPRMPLSRKEALWGKRRLSMVIDFLLFLLQFQVTYIAGIGLTMYEDPVVLIKTLSPPTIRFRYAGSAAVFRPHGSNCKRHHQNLHTSRNTESFPGHRADDHFSMWLVSILQLNSR